MTGSSKQPTDDWIAQAHPVTLSSNPARQVITRLQAKQVADEVEQSEEFPNDVDMTMEQLADLVLSEVIKWKPTKVHPPGDQLRSLLPDAKLY